MELPLLMFLSLGALLLSASVLGHQKSVFLDNHKRAIQDYIMTGHENGWQNCDILTESAYSYEGVPQMTTNLAKLNTINMKYAFASSHCLLVIYDVKNSSSLSTLFEFGWKAVLHMRLALVLKMAPGVTLEMASNKTRLPFLVAAELADGKEQFLCPVVGENEPRLEQDMCKDSYVSFKGKTLRLGLVGILPNFLLNSDGSIVGTNIMIINMLSERLGFDPKLVLATSYNDAENLVCYQHQCV